VVSKETKLREPVLVVYAEKKSLDDDAGLVELELHAETIHSFEEAIALEHQLELRAHCGCEQAAYYSPYIPGFGSITMQLLKALYIAQDRAYVEEIKYEPTTPKSTDVPNEITPEWLADHLSRALGVPVSNVATDAGWELAKMSWDTNKVKELENLWGRSMVDLDMLVVFTLAVKGAYYKLSNVEALGVRQVGDAFRVYFKRKHEKEEE